MRDIKKIDLLVLGCILSVTLLVAIQVYLVSNTYRLTRDNYKAEVKAALTGITKTPAGIAWENRIKDSVKSYAGRYVTAKLDRQGLLAMIRTRIDPLRVAASRYYDRVIRDSLQMEGVNYLAGYWEIITEYNSRRDTLLAVNEAPLYYIGAQPVSGPLFFLDREQERTGSQERTKTGRTGIGSSFYLNTLTNHFVSMEGWQRQVIWRMAGVLSLAAGLILSVVTLFYLVFRAMFRQKKLAEIRTDMSNNLAHELKTPLSSAGLILKSLEHPDAQTDPALFKELLASLHRQQNKLQRIVDVVMDDAIGAGSPPALEPTDMTDFLSAYARTVQPGAHDWAVAIAPASQLVLTDQFLLEKVLDNLLDNAFQYTPGNSTVRLEGFIEGNDYLIRVIDNGPGIAAEFREQVFEKFYRVPDQNRHRVKGLGLGLAIARDAVQALGGSLLLGSAAGSGCIFTIRLPLILAI